MLDLPRLPRFALLCLGLLAAAAATEACASDSNPSQSSGTGTVAGAGGAGGAGTTTGGEGGASLLPGYCSELCDHLASIMCPSWDNCATECPVAPGCPVQYEAKVKCWVENKADFTCTPEAVVPPPQCAPFEEALQECIGGASGAGGDACPGQVCGSDEMKCSCKTACGNAEFKSACVLQGEEFACSCYNHDDLLGTCIEADAANKCHNDLGCCAPYFSTM